MGVGDGFEVAGGYVAGSTYKSEIGQKQFKLQTSINQFTGKDGLDIEKDMLFFEQFVEIDFHLAELSVCHGDDGGVEFGLGQLVDDIAARRVFHVVDRIRPDSLQVIALAGFHIAGHRLRLVPVVGRAEGDGILDVAAVVDDLVNYVGRHEIAAVYSRGIRAYHLYRGDLVCLTEG